MKDHETNPAGNPPQTLRTRASKRLHTLEYQDLVALGPEKTKQLLHELQVHQIELEIQNEDLRRAQMELDATRARYFDLYDFAPVGYCTLCENGLILTANIRAATLLGVARGELIKKSMTPFIRKEDQDIYYLCRKKLLDTSIPQVFELRMVKKDETVFWVRLHATVSHDSAGSTELLIVLSDITEHKQAAEALWQSENRFRKMFEQHSAVKLILDAETGNIIDANQAAAQFYGWPVEKLKQMHIQEINTLPPEAVQAEMKKAGLCSGASFEFRHRRADGSIREVEVFSHKIEIAGKSCLYSIIHDITDRKQIEEMLKKNQEEMQIIMDSSPIMIFYKDCENRFIRVNKTLAEVTGLPKEAMEGKTMYEIYPNQAKYFWEDDKEVIASGIPKIGIIEQVDTPTGRRWAQTDKIPYKDATGRIIGIIGFAVDITERKNAEESIRSIALFPEENPSPVLRIGVDGELLYSNRSSEPILEEWLADYGKDVPDSLRRCVEDALASGLSVKYQVVVCGRDISFQVCPVSERNYANLYGWDITERMQAEEAQRQSEKQLLAINDELERRVERRTQELQESQSHYLHAEKLSAIGKLSASIAHEFNNPLQGIMSILKGLKKRAILEEEDRELLNAAIGESERIKNLIRSLQDFNRPSSGRKVMMDVHKSIDSLLLLCKSDFKSKRISTAINYAERLPQILAIPDQIKQVFLNLLTNAADACFQPGGVITISTRLEEQRVAVAIKDTGIGITSERMGLIFQPFYTTKPAVKGTGLGLSVCHGIVQTHQGEIRVESRPGEGSTFTVLLPTKGE